MKNKLVKLKLKSGASSEASSPKSVPVADGPYFLKITPNLFLSNAFTVEDSGLLSANNICAIISLTSKPLEAPAQSPFERYNFILSDRNSQCIEKLLDPVVEIIDEKAREGKNVVIHCKKGISRAPTFVAAYLTKCLEMSVEDALCYLKKISSRIEPNFNFLLQLEVWAQTYQTFVLKQG